MSDMLLNFLSKLFDVYLVVNGICFFIVCFVAVGEAKTNPEKKQFWWFVVLAALIVAPYIVYEMLLRFETGDERRDHE